MLGGEGEEGLIQLAANEIFRIAKSDQQRQIKIKCSFFQCYMQQVHDLLSTKVELKTRKPIMENLAKSDKGNPSKQEIKTEDDVRNLLMNGNGSRNKYTCNNGENDKSSRSNVVFQLFIETSPRGGATAANSATSPTLTFGN